MKVSQGFLKLFFLLALIIPTIFTQDPCNDNNIKSCQDCKNKAPICGWCAATQKCLNGSLDGPLGEEKCYGAAWEFQKCTECGSLQTCGSCLEFNADCFWCEAGTHQNECVSVNTVSLCQKKFTNSCPCNAYGSCTDCLERSRGDCVWCSNSTTCVPKDNTGGCLIAHTCPCNSNQDCLTCQADDGCGWCTQEARCTKVSDGDCQLLAHTCPTVLCQDHLSCDQCHNEDGCKWCSDLGGCKPNNKNYNCVTPLKCSTYCAAYKSCDVCNEIKGCGWCSKLNKCSNLADNECLITHSCASTESSKKKGGFDGGSFVGGMFLVIGLIGFGVIGYLVYKWKFSDRASYQELTVNGNRS